MASLTLPMIALYEGAVIAVKLIERTRAKAASSTPAAST